MSGRSHDFGQPIPGYEVLELLGSGGMSSVYRARQRGLDRMVAIKVIRRDQIDPGTALQRLTKEAKVLARLDHPGIVRSIDFGETGDLVWFVMELVEGQSLKQLLVEKGRLPMREVLVVAEQVARALGHAASHGVVHRDVKPGNILLAKDGSVKLTDFGLARAALDRSLTRDGITVGTPQYMSPEQVKSPRRVDLKSDLYSLGATLYHLATGEPPVRGETIGEILHDVLYGQPQPPEQIEPSIPHDFSRILARLLAKNPVRRYGDVDSLLADLARVRTGLPVAGANAAEVGLSWQESSEPAPSRWRTPLLAGVAALVLAGAVGAIAFGPWRGTGGVDETAAREERLLAELAAALDQRTQPPAQILAHLADLKQDGTLTAASGMQRNELRQRARTEVEEALKAAAAKGREAARAALAAGDFAAARAAFAQTFTAGRAAALPPELKARIETEEEGLTELERNLEAAGLAAQDELEQAVAHAVRTARTDVRNATQDALGAALGANDLAAALELVADHPALEDRTLVAATRTSLEAFGVRLAAELRDDDVRRRWPAWLREELARTPVEEPLSVWRQELEATVARVEGRLGDDVRRARDDDLTRIEAGELDVDPAARRRELSAAATPALATLANAGLGHASYAAALDDYSRKVTAALAHHLAERQANALTELLEGNGEESGLDVLLKGQKMEAARARFAAARGLEPAAAATVAACIGTVARGLDAVREGLRARIGSEVMLRDRRGLGMRGTLALDRSGDGFTIGARASIRVEEISFESMVPFLSELLRGDEEELLLRFYLGDEKARGEVDALLVKLPDSPVVARVRRLRQEETSNATTRQQERTALAGALDENLKAARAAGDWDGAYKALEQLLRLRDTPPGQAAARTRADIEQAIAEGRRASRQQDRVAELAVHAATRVTAADGTTTLEYDFADPAVADDFGVKGNAVRVENGRLRFAGGETGRSTGLFGPTLPLPIDRRAKVTLNVKLFVPTDEPAPPNYVGLRVGGLCLGLYRPTAPVREVLAPQLAAWTGTLDEMPSHFALTSLGQSEPAIGHCEPVGLERGTHHVVELRWLPGSTSADSRSEIYFDGAKVYTIEGAMAGPPDQDGIELRSTSALQVERLEFKGRIKS